MEQNRNDISGNREHSKGVQNLPFPWAVAFDWFGHHGRGMRIRLAWMARSCACIFLDIVVVLRKTMLAGMDSVCVRGLVGCASGRDSV